MDNTITTEFVKSFPGFPRFGMGALSDFVFYRSYSRGMKESWRDVITRVMDGIQNLYYSSSNAAFEINWKEMYQRMFYYKFLPGGRCLWALGSKMTETKHVYASINNCAFVSTLDIEFPSRPYAFMMDMLMLGVGVGFDTTASGRIAIHTPGPYKNVYVVPDSREGWVSALRLLLNSYMYRGQNSVGFDYSKIRKEGLQLECFGGISAGSKPLQILLEDVRKILSKEQGNFMSTQCVVDIANLIGKCVIAGNIRRSAEIAIGNYIDDAFVDLKDVTAHPERSSFSWVSNNSVACKLGSDYSKIANSIVKNGEPGVLWMDNMRKYSRMGELDFKDIRAQGVNPCSEQTLESYEMCSLVEVFPALHDSYEDFEQSLRYAFLFVKITTLAKSHWEETAAVTQRNRRVGCSISGIAQFLSKRSKEELINWCDRGYKFLKKLDENFSAALKINKSIKITCVKPSGTVSLLAGATPGMHYPVHSYFVRRIIVPVCMLEMIEKNKIKTIRNKSGDTLAEFYFHFGNVPTQEQVSPYDQVELAALLQKHWADNQVSCTISFDPKFPECVREILDKYQHSLKGISFLPLTRGVYDCMPYEEVSKTEYEKYRDVVFKIHNDSCNDSKECTIKFCDSDSCMI